MAIGCLGVGWICVTTQAQIVSMEMEVVPYHPNDPATQQPGGLNYSFEVARHEVTVGQFIAFLNDAEANQDNERGDNLAFHANGDVGLPKFEGPDDDTFFDMSDANDNGLFSYGVVYDASSPLGSRYTFDSAFADHPIIAVSWFSGLKFANWLTLDQGYPPEERVYHEGSAQGDWYPLSIGDEINGSQKDTWASRDLTDAERMRLVLDYAGFRLPRDMNSSFPGPFNEWTKVGSWDGGDMVDRIYGFGRDLLTSADANSLDSGDPWETGTSPVGYYDGTNKGTAGNENFYSVLDLSGNAMEWMQDQAIAGRRSQRGGAYTDIIPDQQLRIDVVRNNFPMSTGEQVGLRMVRVPSCDGDVNGDGAVDPLDSGFVLARFGCQLPGGGTDCVRADANGDGNVDPLDSGFVLARFGDCP